MLSRRWTGLKRTGPRGNRLLDTIGDMMRAWYRFVVLAGILPSWRAAIPGPGKHRDDFSVNFGATLVTFPFDCLLDEFRLGS